MNMNLTPEQRAIGKQNFHAAIGSEHTRRQFLKDSLAAAVVAGGGLGAFYFGYKSIKDTVKVGIIGTGDEGNVLIGSLNPGYFDVVAIADIRPYSIYRAFHGEVAQPARPGLLKVYRDKWKTVKEAQAAVTVYREGYRELLRDPKVEAVIIALPLHLHAQVAIEAMLAGKHVLTEKLMGRTVAQCKEMARFADQTNLILAVGHQRHYNILYDNAVDLIKRGLLGDLHYIRAQWHRAKDTWKPGLPPGTRTLPPGAKPEKGEPDLLKTKASWERKLKEAKAAKDSEEEDLWTRRLAQIDQQINDKADAAKYDYRKIEVKDPAGKVRYQGPPLEELIRWRLWARTGAGIMAELGSHQLDAASIFIAAAHDLAEAAGKQKLDEKARKRSRHPLSVSAVANRNLFDWDREIEDHLSCLIEFRAPGYNEKDALGRQRTITVAYTSMNGNGFGGYGECVFGTKGTLLLEEEKQALLYPTESDTTVVSTKIEVKKKKDEAVLDTQASPGAAKAAAAGAAGLGPDVSRGYREELEHWAWCIRQHKKGEKPKFLPRCHPEVALKDAVIALTANLAAIKRQTIQFDEDWFDYTKDATPDDSKINMGQYKKP